MSGTDDLTIRRVGLRRWTGVQRWYHCYTWPRIQRRISMALLRRLVVDVDMKVTDAEDFVPNERKRVTFQGVNFVGPGGQRATIAKAAVRVGGEVRAELDLTTRLGAGSNVVVEGSAKLFEGTSENTTDLDDSEEVVLDIAPGQSLKHVIGLLNRALAESDTAVTNLVCTNGDALAEVARRGGTALTARHSGKVLDVAGMSTDLGAPFIQWQWLDGANQKFRIEPVDDQFVRFVALHSGLVLDVGGASLDDGAPLIQWEWLGQDNQVFRLEPTNGDLVIVAKHSDKVLDVAGVSTQNGAPVTQFTRNFQPNQQWRF